MYKTNSIIADQDRILAAQIKTTEDLVNLFANNTPTAFRLGTSFVNIAKLFNAEIFKLLCNSPLVKFPQIKQLVEIIALAEIIQDKQTFLYFSELNPLLSLLLYSDKRFEDFANTTRYNFQPKFNYIAKTYSLTGKKEQKWRLKSPSLTSLDLAQDEATTIDIKTHSPNTRLSALLDENVDQLTHKLLAKHFSTYKSYFEKMMFGPSGYYSKGKVNFGKDFSTYGANSLELPGFAMALAKQLFFTWQNLIQANQLTEKDAFNVLECGAGTGDLCLAILTHIANMAKINKEWNTLYQRIHYHIVDKSPILIEKQRTTTKAYAKKISIINADACFINLNILKKSMAAVISNELLDMLAPHIASLDNKGEFQLPIIIFMVTETALKNYFIPGGAKVSIKELINKSRILHGLCKASDKNFEDCLPKNAPKDLIFLSEEDFLKLHPYVDKGHQPFSRIMMNIPIENIFSELNDFLERNKEYFPQILSYQNRCIEVFLYTYLKAMNSILIPGGEIISVDYGNDFFHTFQSLMTYDEGKGTDIFVNPGHIDITHHVNFTTLAEEGKRLGLLPVFFGKQEQMSLDNVPNNVLSEQNKNNFLDSSKRREFHLLLQRKESAPAILTQISAKRFNGGSKPVTHFQLFKHHLKNATSFYQESLLSEAKEICTINGKLNYASYLTAIENKQYTAALRKACADGLKNHIYLILNFIPALDPRFNINEPSSNGLTAYDWLKTAKIDQKDKAMLLNELERLGAKGKDELKNITQVNIHNPVLNKR